MYSDSEKEVHQYLDEYFQTHSEWTHDDDHLSRFHRSWVRKNKNKYKIKKTYERKTGQPIYDYGQKRGPQYRAKGKHVGWGGSMTYVIWSICKIGE